MKVYLNNQWKGSTGITVTITSCGRVDLLQKTISSLYRTAGCLFNVLIYDDSADEKQHRQIFELYGKRFDLYFGDKRMGQAFALDFIYDQVKTPWIFHCEDDWEFVLPWYIQDSIRVLTADPNILICGLAIRQDYFKLGAAVNLHEVGGVKVWDQPKWRIDENHGWWYGWVGSPNLKRTADMCKLPKFSSVMSEEEWDREVFGKSGKKSVWLNRCCVRHIGYGRSLFVEGDMLIRDWRKPR